MGPDVVDQGVRGRAGGRAAHVELVATPFGIRQRWRRLAHAPVPEGAFLGTPTHVVDERRNLL